MVMSSLFLTHKSAHLPNTNKYADNIARITSDTQSPPTRHMHKTILLNYFELCGGLKLQVQGLENLLPTLLEFCNILMQSSDELESLQNILYQFNRS